MDEAEGQGDTTESESEDHTESGEIRAENEDHNRIKYRILNGCMWLGRGMRKDLRRRLPWYFNDWREGLHFRVLGSICYMFFTSIAPAITFGIYLQDATDRQMGIVEVLFSTSLCGVVCALLFGQPLIIVGVTG